MGQKEMECSGDANDGGIELSFLATLPVAVHDSCADDVAQVQQLLAKLRKAADDSKQAAAALAAQQQPVAGGGPEIHEINDDEPVGCFGAAPSHSDAARVGPYKGAEKPVTADVSANPGVKAMANFQDELAVLFRSGSVTPEHLQQLQSQVSGLQASLNKERAQRSASSDSVEDLSGSWVQERSHLG